ncbi:MAG: hypothetical protein IJO21_06060 [Oscillospiraceae bacterium]|nr:hypothetical protein [Oscillospiraceae bacterium]MBQ7130584.1 hypothetical protein [Oscillospiraceae bacterium]
MNILKKSAAAALILLLLLTAMVPAVYAAEVPASETQTAAAEQTVPAETQPAASGSTFVPSTIGKTPIVFSGNRTDFSALQDLMAQVGDLKEFDYTAESWANLMSVMKKCNKVLKGSGQNAVNTAINDLEAAIEALVPMNYTVLQAALDNYDAVLKENKQMHEAWVKLDEAVVLAKEQFATGDQKAVNEAADRVNALLAEREAYEVPETEPQVVTKEVQVEVLPTGDFCNIPLHRVWPVLFAVSGVLNVVLACVLVFVIKHKNKSMDETPLVNYDIYDDMDDYT